MAPRRSSSGVHARGSMRAARLYFPGEGLLFTLSPWQFRQASRRRRILSSFGDLCARGVASAAAARLLKVSRVSIWRWKRRPIPRTDLCGRKPDLALPIVPPWAFRTVQQIQASGKAGNVKAWRSLARRPKCPPDLASYLQRSKAVPQIWLRASRLVRTHIVIETKLTIIEGSNGFTRYSPGSIVVRKRQHGDRHSATEKRGRPS